MFQKCRQFMHKQKTEDEDNNKDQTYQSSTVRSALLIKQMYFPALHTYPENNVEQKNKIFQTNSPTAVFFSWSLHSEIKNALVLVWVDRENDIQLGKDGKQKRSDLQRFYQSPRITAR